MKPCAHFFFFLFALSLFVFLFGIIGRAQALLVATWMLLLSCEWEEQCLEMSQALINVLSWRDLVEYHPIRLRQNSLYQLQISTSRLSTPLYTFHGHNGRTAHIALCIRRCSIVFSFILVLVWLVCFVLSLCIFITLKLEPWQKMGQCNTHSSPEGDVVIGQLFEGLLVKCKWSVASKCQRQLCLWLASPSGCEDDPSKL